MRSSIQSNERDQRDLLLTGIEERDGIFYKFIDSSEWYKYKLLNDIELREEQGHCEEIAKRILDTEQRKKSSIPSSAKSRERPLSASRASFSKTTPTPTSKEIQSKKSKDDSYPGTSSRTQAVSTSLKDAAKKRVLSLEKSLENDTLLSNTTLTPEQVLQIKYQKNLEVIEKLYIEKQEAELKTKKLERELRKHSHSWRPPSPNPSQKHDRFNDGAYKETRKKPSRNNFLSSTSMASSSIDNVLYGTIIKTVPELSDLQEDSEVDSGSPIRGGGDEAINMGEAGHPDQGGDSVAPPQSSEEPELSRGRDDSDLHRRISGVEAASMNFSTGAGSGAGTAVRPSSVSRTGSSVRPFSASSAVRRSNYHIDRAQAQSMYLSEKTSAQREVEEYELEKKKSLERAMRGSLSESLQESHETARRKAREKLQKRREQERAEERELKQQEELKKKALKDLYARSCTDTDLEKLKAAEETRKEIKARRMRELQETASLPNNQSFAASIEKAKEAMQTEEKREAIKERKKRDEELKKRKEESERRRQIPQYDSTLDPEEVTERLKRQHAVWTATMAKRKEESETQKRTPTPPPKQLLSMERRREVMEQKKKEAVATRRKKKEEEERRKREEERLRIERLMALPVPPAGINNTARQRAEKAHEMMEKRRKEEAKAEARKQKALKREKEISKMTMYEIAQFDAERREKIGGNYVEIFNIDQISAKKSQAEKAESEARRKANQQKIQEKLAERPSLMTRQAQEQQGQAAKMAALTKVANASRTATGAGKGKGKGGDLDDAIFTNEERAKVAAYDEYDLDPDD